MDWLTRRVLGEAPEKRPPLPAWMRPASSRPASHVGPPLDPHGTLQVVEDRDNSSSISVEDEIAVWLETR